MKNTDLEKLKLIFTSILDLKDDINIENLTKLSQPNWDSLAQVSLISAIANEFSVEIEVNEFELFTSFNAVRILLESKGI